MIYINNCPTVWKSRQPKSVIFFNRGYVNYGVVELTCTLNQAINCLVQRQAVFYGTIYAFSDLHEDFLLQVPIRKLSFNINIGIKITRQIFHHKNSKFHLTHNRGKVIIEVETRNLVVPTIHQTSSKYSISLDLKQPFNFDTLITIRHLRFSIFLYDSAQINFLKLSINGTLLVRSLIKASQAWFGGYPTKHANSFLILELSLDILLFCHNAHLAEYS
jgi:hypothetical protein